MAQHDNELPDHGAALRLFRQIAAAPETGPQAAQHPDCELLDLCSLILDLRREERINHERFREVPGRDATKADTPGKEFLDAKIAADNAQRTPMAKVGKLRAITPAGIYAKALLLRSSRGHAPKLAEGLAEDLINAPGLRTLLWPADVQEGR